MLSCAELVGSLSLLSTNSTQPLSVIVHGVITGVHTSGGQKRRCSVFKKTLGVPCAHRGRLCRNLTESSTTGHGSTFLRRWEFLDEPRFFRRHVQRSALAHQCSPTDMLDACLGRGVFHLRAARGDLHRLVSDQDPSPASKSWPTRFQMHFGFEALRAQMFSAL